MCVRARESESVCVSVCERKRERDEANAETVQLPFLLFAIDVQQ